MRAIEIIKRTGLSVYLMETGFSGEIDAQLSLTENELVKLNSITHPHKKTEYLVSRHLRTEIFGKKQIMYTETGAPYIDHQGFISLSHTEGLVGIAYSPDFKVGLDLECVRQKAADISHRFVHEREKHLFNTSDSYDMSLLWSAKETLFKLAGRKGVIFAEQLWLEKSENGYRGCIEQPFGTERFDIAVSGFKGKLITCNTSAGEIEL